MRVTPTARSSPLRVVVSLHRRKPNAQGEDPSAAAHGRLGRSTPELCLRLLCAYLRELFEADPLSAGRFADLHVSLLARYDQGRLMPFLSGSVPYSLEHALEVAAGHNLVREQARTGKHNTPVSSQPAPK